MNWRLKCLAFHVLGRVPFGQAAHRAFQRLLTKRYFQRVTAAKLGTPELHLRHFRTLPAGAVALEFGCGRDLLTSLLLSHAGAERVYAYDLVRLATIEQINGVIGQLRTLLPGDWPPVSSFEELSTHYRIDYRAPADARATGLADGSVDFVCSSAVMEHVPEGEIRAIMKECARICTPRAKVSFLIDYHDHYASADRNITMWNFYRYTDRQWRKFNPGNHYQNRLRHSDYARIFADLGFAVSSSEGVIPDWGAAQLARVPLSPDFAHYSQDDLITLSGKYVLTPPTAAGLESAAAPAGLAAART